jgi:uncharacterized protein (TIGR03435 family)
MTLIRAAFKLQAYQIADGPNWAANEAYDISAQAEAGTALTFDQLRPLLQRLLADRFQLKFHRESKDGVGYALMPAKSGPKLQESVAPEYSTHVTSGSDVQIVISRATMAQLCSRLTVFAGRPVIDKTGLAGVFDLKLNFAPEDATSEFPSLFTALQEQLGLRLESIKAPLEMLVIDRVERPSAN